jgi:phage portal protein BeeE
MWKDGMAFRFDATDLTRANTAAMAEKHFKAVRGGWMRPNEVRMRDGLPPDVNGDELMMSRDLLPLWLLVNKPEMLLSSQRGKTNGEGENS